MFFCSIRALLYVSFSSILYSSCSAYAVPPITYLHAEHSCMYNFIFDFFAENDMARTPRECSLGVRNECGHSRKNSVGKILLFNLDGATFMTEPRSLGRKNLFSEVLRSSVIVIKCSSSACIIVYHTMACNEMIRHCRTQRS